MCPKRAQTYALPSILVNGHGEISPKYNLGLIRILEHRFQPT